MLAKLRPTAFAALLALGAQLAVVPLATAQIVAYKPAPASQRPTVLSAGNGVPLINIQTPSAAGVSRNTYSQFDVDAQGAILNNSRNNVQTQLGGWVQGNPWLARGTARVILNEVISANPSQLLGYVEIAGSKAEVVIANPAGVTCNGCGFINASRATLTTGTPIMNGGALEGYRVEGGTLRIEGAGMDASRVAYSDLIARAVEVNAGIWAQNLAVTAGTNTVNAANTQATPIAPAPGSGAAPAFAIDVASLGGMYAGKIVLVGTEAGVGVRNAGHLGASAGEVRVTVDGRLENSGEIVANGKLTMAASSLENRNLIDGGDTRIDVAGTLDNLGSARIYGDHLAIAAGALNNHSIGSDAPTIAARTRLDLGVGTLSNRNDALVFSAGDMAIGGALDASNQATGSATLMHNHGATLEALGNLAIAAADIKNTNADLVTQTITESSRLIQEVQPEGWPARHDVQYFPTIFNYGIEAQPYINGSTVLHFEDYTFYEYTATTTATEVVRSKPGKILAGGNASFTGNLENSDSRIVAGGTLGQRGGSLANNATPGIRTTTYSGWAQFRDWDGRDEELDFGPRVAFSPAPEIIAFDLGVATWREGSAPASVGTVPGPAGNSLYRPAVGASYLIETDPRFAGYRQWLSSDYMLQQLSADPATTQKRLGDGFYEQRLLTEQIASLTGRRFLAGYANEEEQYKALMNAGIAFAKTWQLRPGVALTAAQMARLTSDMVWLVEKEVTLADGRTQKALVPQLYARVREGDLTPAGSLLSGERIDIAASGSVSNLGTIAGRQLVSLSADTIRNLGGSVRGEDIRLSAGRDIEMKGGTLDADRSLDLVAGRNIEIASSTRASEQREGGGDFSRSNIDRVAALYVRDAGGQMQIAASGDIALLAAHLINTAPAGAGREKREASGEADSAGTTRIIAGGNLTLGTVTVEEKNHTGGKGYRNESGSRSEIGTRIASDGDVTLEAGATLAARAAEVASSEGRILASGKDIVLEAGEASSYSDISQQKKSSGFLSSKSKSQRDTFEDTTAIATTLSGDSVTLLADRDIQVKGSNVAATHDTALIAGRNLSIEAAAESHNETHYSKTKQSGVFGSGGVGFTLGSKQNSTDQQSEATTAAKSTVGSIEGNVTLLAGEQYRQVGSDVIAAKGDIDIAAKTVDIVEARETSRTTTEQKSKQSGLTLAITSPVISAIQTVQQVAEAAPKVQDPRLQALAAATAGVAVKNATDAVAADPQAGGGVGISITVGGSKSQSKTTQTNDTAATSNLTAGHDIRIEASGAGNDSDILLQGAQVTAARNILLTAEDEIALLAARNDSDLERRSKGSSAGVGLAVTYGSNGFAAGITANASASKGKADGHDTSYTNTQIEAGKLLAIESGGDTIMKGAVARGEQVIADIGGDLRIESLQDTSTYKRRDGSLGGSVTIGYGFAASANIGQQKIDSDYRSVTEQSGIQAGDGGFDIRVQNNTDLKGALIASTERAAAEGRNRLETGTLTVSDIKNKAEYDASSINLGVGYTSDDFSLVRPNGGRATETRSGIGTDQQGKTATGDQVPGSILPDLGGFSAGVPLPMSADDKADSTTKGGISAATIILTDDERQKTLTGKDAATTLASLNRDVATGRNTANTLAPIFDEKKLDAQFAIVAAFSREMGTFLVNRGKEADAKKAERDEAAAKGDRNAFEKLDAEYRSISEWGAGGIYRQALTALTAAATGNVSATGSQFMQAAVVNFVQQQAASSIKDFAKDLGIAEGSAGHAALHAIVGCAGAAASGQNCGAGAAGAAASSFIGGLLGAVDGLSEFQKEARRNLVSNLVLLGAVVSGAPAATASNAALAEYDNNQARPPRAQNLPRIQEYWNIRAQALIRNINSRGGNYSEARDPAQPANYSERDIQRLEETLRRFDPYNPLLTPAPSTTVSPVPEAYVRPGVFVDMRNVQNPRGENSAGFGRDHQAFWQEMLARNPEFFSPANQSRILEGLAPRIDVTWARSFPTQASFAGETLVHHHLLNGPYAVPLPQSVHQQWNSALHPFNQQLRALGQ